MKQVIILVPDGYADLGTITGTLEILTRANELWQRMGNRSVMEIRIAGFVTELKLDVGFFSVRPLNIKQIENADLLIIPSVSHHYDNIIDKNLELISWIR